MSTGKIEHVVVLMLENRSFDCMLGRLYPSGSAFDGLHGDEANLLHPPTGGPAVRIGVWNDAGMDPGNATIPDPDPGELFVPDMTTQLFGLAGTASAPPTMSGFVDNYVRQKVLAGTVVDPKAVMHFFTEKQVPVISELAVGFGVSDRWHASAPCQTWPNRFFAHTATAGGWVNNNPPHFPYTMPSIFRRLGDHGRSWKVYFHDLPQSATLADLWTALPTHFRLFEREFEADALAGRLPHYSFIEPRYFTNPLLQQIPNDQHPPHNVTYGEQLIATVYNAVRRAPTWRQTLLIVTYDEHGGCYDHVPPPAAVPPSAGPYPDGFRFDRYGVRVPAVLISPWIPKSSIIRPDDWGAAHPFDHTSIIATLRKLFDLGEPLSARDAAAPDLLPALSLSSPDNLGPDTVGTAPIRPSPAEVADAASASPSGMQQGLVALAGHLPDTVAAIPGRLDALRAGRLQPELPPRTTVAQAHAFATDRLSRVVSV